MTFKPFALVGLLAACVAAAAADAPVIGLITKTDTNPFFVKMKEGASQAAKAGGAKLLSAAGKAGIPQVVSVGALDMVNFGPMDTVPDQFKDRNLYVHNPITTLMRTTAAENTELGTRLARRLNAATGPTSLFLPLRGVSAIDVAGAPFRDEAADRALFGAIHDGLDTQRVELVEMDTDINDDRFADAMADRLHQLITKE